MRACALVLALVSVILVSAPAAAQEAEALRRELEALVEPQLDPRGRVGEDGAARRRRRHEQRVGQSALDERQAEHRREEERPHSSGPGRGARPRVRIATITTTSAPTNSASPAKTSADVKGLIGAPRSGPP